MRHFRHWGALLGAAVIATAAIASAHAGTGGSLGGRLTRFADGTALTGATVFVFDLSGGQTVSTVTDSNGDWRVDGLPAATFDLYVPSPDGMLLEELWPGVQCDETGCGGAHESIVLGAGAEQLDLDFALAPAATLPVTLRRVEDQQPILGTVRVLLPYGPAPSDVATTPDGVAMIRVLTGGDVRLAASGSGCGPAGDRVCLPMRYPETPCEGLQCDLAGGTPVAVVKGTQHAGVTIALGNGASIAGHVIAEGGAPIDGALAEIFDATGTAIALAGTDASGAFRADGLAAGVHYVRSNNAAGFIDERYDDIACGPGACDVTEGTPVLTTIGQNTDGIDMTLVREAALAGTVRSALPAAVLPGAVVTVYDDAGNAVSTTTSGANGGWRSTTLQTGTYRVEFAHVGYATQRYDNVACAASGCAPGSGTPVSVAASTVLNGIDATLTRAVATGPRGTAYINRCAPAGCSIVRGPENSVNNTSSIIGPSVVNFPPFSGSAAVFDDTVRCVRDMMRPYRIDIVTDDPSPAPHHEVIFAGTPDMAGLSGQVAGVSPFTCGVIHNAIVFTFAQTMETDVGELCHTTAHEIAHSFGLEHEASVPDTMSYHSAPIKYFTNADVTCGEFEGVPQPCLCGSSTQNSHLRLGEALGYEDAVFADTFEADAKAVWRAPASSKATSPLTCATDTRKPGIRAPH